MISYMRVQCLNYSAYRPPNNAMNSVFFTRKCVVKSDKKRELQIMQFSTSSTIHNTCNCIAFTDGKGKKL